MNYQNNLFRTFSNYLELIRFKYYTRKIFRFRIQQQPRKILEIYSRNLLFLLLLENRMIDENLRLWKYTCNVRWNVLQPGQHSETPTDLKTDRSKSHMIQIRLQNSVKYRHNGFFICCYDKALADSIQWLPLVYNVLDKTLN